jgi:hypothetical protein
VNGDMVWRGAHDKTRMNQASHKWVDIDDVKISDTLNEKNDYKK